MIEDAPVEEAVRYHAEPRARLSFSICEVHTMKCTILHESRGRIRVHLACRAMSLREADVLEYYLRAVPGVVDVKVFDRTQDAVVSLSRTAAPLWVQALAAFSFQRAEAMELVPEHTSRALNREFEDKLVFTVCRRMFNRLFLPVPVATAITLFRSVKYIREGLKALWHGKLSVAVLDATAVTVSMVRGDFATRRLRDVHAAARRDFWRSGRTRSPWPISRARWR